MARRGSDWYYLPSGEYSSQFLKALAMANHTGKCDPAELAYWFDKNWTQKEIAVELYNRVKPKDKPQYTVDEA